MEVLPIFDIAVVGSGFAGSLMAMICHRLGRSVILLERGRHPRFTIGESSTPLANLLLEELSVKYHLPAIAPFSKWGTWQHTYPQVACGLKRGFSFFHHVLGEQETTRFDRQSQLLVAASPNDRIADTHWYRPEFDQFFVQEAQNLGITYWDEADITAVSDLPDEMKLSGSRHGREIEVRARFVIDATGPRGFLHRALHLPEVPIPDMPATQALYSHFTGVGNYSGFRDAEVPPYPVDAAAVHHVFEGGWIWVLQFNNGVTSAGVASEHIALENGEEAWLNVIHQIPALQKQFANARKIRPFTYVPRLSFRSGTLSGKRWALLPSAAGFVDPMLSTGFALTLLGISRLGEIIENHWGAHQFSSEVAKMTARSDKELLAAGRLIGSLYSGMSNFSLFAPTSLIYFTAVIYAETVRRLGKPELAQSFLLHDHPDFGPHCLRLFERIKTGEDSKSVVEEIRQVIEPLNLAGLGNPSRRNWYPVDPQDLFAGASKVNATTQEISALLERSGFITQ